MEAYVFISSKLESKIASQLLYASQQEQFDRD